jgi:Cellulase (glycosyl hydrolase family 5)
MSKTLVKRLLWLVILITLVITGAQFVSWSANLIAYFQTGADPASALNLVPNIKPDTGVTSYWNPDDANIGQQIDPYTRNEIAVTYLRAWLQLTLSYQKGAPYDLETYFGKPLLPMLEQSIRETHNEKMSIDQIDLEHHLTVHFYSKNQDMITFTDSDMQLARLVTDTNNNTRSFEEYSATYDVLMCHEDTRWRVLQWNRTAEYTLDNTPPPEATTLAGFVGKQGTQLVVNNQPMAIAGINYYPQQTPWNLFWSHFQPATIDHDFSIIHDLGLNAIRIFIPFAQFGGQHVGVIPQMQIDAAKKSKQAQDTYDDVVADPLGKLDTLLTLAQLHQLYVIPTLFDFFGSYTITRWPQSDRQLETLLTRYKNNPTILAWDIKNEPDLDYASNGKDLVNAWLTHTLRMAREFDPYHLMTIGWSTPQAASIVLPGEDIISFHYSTTTDQLAKAYDTLRSANPLQPIMLSEFGLTTWDSGPLPGGHSALEQENYYASTLQTLRKTDAAGYLAWTLYDYPSVPNSLSPWPWIRWPQGHFGIIDSNGSLKPSAHLLAPNARLLITPIPWWQSVFTPLRIKIVFLIIVVGLLAFTGRRVWRNRHTLSGLFKRANGF